MWPGSGPTVLGLPGLGSSGRAWGPLAESLPDAHLVSPDLRGRGRSAALTGPTGLPAHARDVKAIAEALDLRDVVVVGHSMGAFLAPLVAQELGDRVTRLVLVDGGVPPKFPFFMKPGLTRKAFRRDLKKADRAWPDAETFTKAFAGKILASRPDLLPTVVSMLEHELAGPPGALRPVLDADRAVEDAVDTFFGPEVLAALEALAVPAHLVAATAGKHDGAKAFLAASVVDHWTARLEHLTSEVVQANHVTVVFTPEVLRAVSP